MKINPTQQDIEALASKLDQVAEILTEQEVGILLAVFSIAGEAIAASRKPDQGSKPSGGKSSLPRLSDAFRAAFKAGATGSYSLAAEHEAASGGNKSEAVSVGAVTITWSE